MKCNRENVECNQIGCPCIDCEYVLSAEHWNCSVQCCNTPNCMGVCNGRPVFEE